MGIILLSLLACTAGDAGAPERLRLLKTFRQEFIAITPGEGQFPKSFQMGGEEGTEQPRHDVTFDYKFEVARYEVPQNLYESVMGDNPSRWKGSRNSVENLSYDDAIEFCRRATTLMREAQLIEANQIVRLPSEAEWEYVARGGTTTQYSFGDDPQLLGEFAWYTGNAAGNDPPVGAKKANPWGLYDVHGYLWEWCLDSARDTYAKAPTNGRPVEEDESTSKRVLRGGSWKDQAGLLRSAARRFAEHDFEDDAVGFRCVISRANEQ